MLPEVVDLAVGLAISAAFAVLIGLCFYGIAYSACLNALIDYDKTLEEEDEI